MFEALVHGRIDNQGIEYEVTLADIFHLNQMAMREELDMVKISYNTYGQIKDRYHLLEAGSALGHDCGPLLIAKPGISLDQLIEAQLPIAIPGRNTTANLLLNFYAPQLERRDEYIFHEIMPAVLEGKAAAGVIIHENRFTYQAHGLTCIQDLGAYWEQQTQLPIPLGAIVANKNLGSEVIQLLEQQMRASVAYAFNNPYASRAYVREHAQEMEEEVMQAHIGLYVNDYSLQLGEKGHQAVDKLLSLR